MVYSGFLGKEKHWVPRWVAPRGRWKKYWSDCGVGGLGEAWDPGGPLSGGAHQGCREQALESCGAWEGEQSRGAGRCGPQEARSCFWISREKGEEGSERMNLWRCWGGPMERRLSPNRRQGLGFAFLSFFFFPVICFLITNKIENFSSFFYIFY